MVDIYQTRVIYKENIHVYLSHLPGINHLEP
jgi:hypothetical protein